MSTGRRRWKSASGTPASSRARPSARCSTTASAACRPMPAMPISTSDLSTDVVVSEIRARAKLLGFDAFGITSADARPDLREKLEAALAAGWHGEMEWMAERADQRADPATLWSRVRSVIMLGVNYGPD